MAIDTAAKRFRMLDFDVPTAPGVPRPDGVLDNDDWMAFLWLYYAGAVPVAPPAIVPSGLQQVPRRRRVAPFLSRLRAVQASLTKLRVRDPSLED